ncbi:hypothetical protein C8R47DRAFT_1232046 [Mycena vitilis]|nr:hypothetical protein C8R47DRAFT_1235814 [Mycena vitilis]KAJ6518098.1 hypothetical protein C8R47DRAFT_1232046 [Mycena vitilis]
MSSPATVYRLRYHNNVAPAPLNLSSVAENDTVVYVAEDTRIQILAIVNSVWDEGLFITFGQLPVLLAPDSTTHRTDRCLESIRHAKKVPVLFIWLEIGSLPPLLSLPNAEYAVAFFLPRVGTFQCLDLSWVVLRFMDEYIRIGNYTRFRLLSICYDISPSGTFGVLFFDNALKLSWQCRRPSLFLFNLCKQSPLLHFLPFDHHPSTMFFRTLFRRMFNLIRPFVNRPFRAAQPPARPFYPFSNDLHNTLPLNDLPGSEKHIWASHWLNLRTKSGENEDDETDDEMPPLE